MLENVFDNGEVLIVFVSELCHLCGGTRQCWPQMNEADTISKYHNDPDFAQEFKAIRGKVKNAEFAEIRPAQVLDGNNISIEVYVKLAFILLKDFIAKWTSCEQMKITVVKLLLPDAERMLGVIMQRYTVPEDVPYFIVKMSATEFVSFEKLILRPEDVRRSAQGREAFAQRSCDVIQKRPPCLRLSNLKEVLTGPDADRKFSVVEDQLNREAAQRLATLGAADQAAISASGVQHQVTRRVGGRVLSSDDEDEAPGQNTKSQGASRRRA